MRGGRWGAALLLALSVGAHPLRGEATAAQPLRFVKDVPLPGPAVRFDYQSLDPVSGRLFIAHMNADRILVFDLRAETVHALPDRFARVHGVWAVPGEGKLFASATGDHQVAFVDLKTLRTTGRVGPVEHPDGLAYVPSARRLFVSDEHGRADAVVNVAAAALVGSIPLGGEAGNTIHDPGSDRVLVAVHDPASVVAIDPRTAAVVSRYPMPGLVEPHGLAIDADHRLLFVAGEGNATLAVFNLEKHVVLERHPVGESPDVLAFDPALGRLYVAAESGRVSIFGVSGRRLVALGSLDAPHAHTVCVDPTTHRVYLPLQEVGGRPVLRIMEP